MAIRSYFLVSRSLFRRFVRRLGLVGFCLALAACVNSANAFNFPSSTEENGVVSCYPGCSLVQETPKWCDEWVSADGEVCRREPDGQEMCFGTAQVLSYMPGPRCRKINLDRLIADPADPNIRLLVDESRTADGDLLSRRFDGIQCDCKLDYKRFGYRNSKPGKEKPDWCHRAWNGCHAVGGIVLAACITPKRSAACMSISAQPIED